MYVTPSFIFNCLLLTLQAPTADQRQSSPFLFMASYVEQYGEIGRWSIVWIKEGWNYQFSQSYSYHLFRDSLGEWRSRYLEFKGLTTAHHPLLTMGMWEKSTSRGSEWDLWTFTLSRSSLPLSVGWKKKKNRSTTSSQNNMNTKVRQNKLFSWVKGKEGGHSYL